MPELETEVKLLKKELEDQRKIHDRLDVAIADMSLEKRKVSLSVKLLEQNLNAEAVSKFGSDASGKNLPFSSLSEKLGKKKKEDK